MGPFKFDFIQVKNKLFFNSFSSHVYVLYVPIQCHGAVYIWTKGTSEKNKRVTFDFMHLKVKALLFGPKVTVLPVTSAAISPSALMTFTCTTPTSFRLWNDLHRLWNITGTGVKGQRGQQISIEEKDRSIAWHFIKREKGRICPLTGPHLKM